MPIRPTRKAQRLAGFAPVAHPLGQMEALNGAGVGFSPTQVGHDLGQFTLAKYRSDFHLFDPPPLPMFDNLVIHQRLGDRTTGVGGRPRGLRRGTGSARPKVATIASR